MDQGEMLVASCTPLQFDLPLTTKPFEVTIEYDS